MAVKRRAGGWWVFEGESRAKGGNILNHGKHGFSRKGGILGRDYRVRLNSSCLMLVCWSLMCFYA